MAYVIEEHLLPVGRQFNRPGTPIRIQGIVSHRTGNPSPRGDSHAHRAYFAGGYRGASVHYFVDSRRILRIIPEHEMAWHAGHVTNKSWTLGNPNYWSIGIELCENHPLESPEGQEAFRRYVWLHADLCRRHRLDPQKDIHGHFEIDPLNRAADPIGLFDWETFLRDVAEELHGDGATPILSAPSATVSQARAWAERNEATPVFFEYLPLYWEIAPQFGVDPAAAAAQSALETAFGRFTGLVAPDMHNPCGLKKRDAKGDGRLDFAAFPSWHIGVKAHVQHLALYAGVSIEKEIVDPRHFAHLLGTATTMEALGGKWAPAPDYGRQIVQNYLLPLQRTTAATPRWDPAAEIQELKKTGLILQEHAPDSLPTWGEFATVINRLVRKYHVS